MEGKGEGEGLLLPMLLRFHPLPNPVGGCGIGPPWASRRMPGARAR